MEIISKKDHSDPNSSKDLPSGSVEGGGVDGYSRKRVVKSRQPHPGSILKKEWMDKRGMTNTDLGKELNHSGALVTRIIKGERDITLKLARKLAKIFNNSHHYWLDLQISYDEAEIKD
jgi:antitoxin HigA-1